MGHVFWWHGGWRALRGTGSLLLEFGVSQHGGVRLAKGTKAGRVCDSLADSALVGFGVVRGWGRGGGK